MKHYRKVAKLDELKAEFDAITDIEILRGIMVKSAARNAALESEVAILTNNIEALERDDKILRKHIKALEQSNEVAK